MLPQRHTSLSLRTQLNAVGETLATCEPSDAFALQRLSQQLLTLRAMMERDSASELVPACTLAIRMVDQLQQSAQFSPEFAMEIVSGLVAVVCGGVGLDGVVELAEDTRAATGTDAADKAPAPQARPEDATPPSIRMLGKSGRPPSLKLVSSRKLGEMLTQMSLLTPAQVEKALNHQRVTGCRFGEALIEMRILTKEAVESALRMQDARRGPKGPWGSR
jgi:hypothetical protein